MRTRIVIRELGKQYLESENYQRGFIPQEWINIVSDTLHLKELSDEELTNMWDMVWLTLDSEQRIVEYDYKDIKEAIKWEDVKSAFTEVVNIEARRRRGER